MSIDFVLIQKMKCGDENAFELFIRKYYKEILKYCSYHCSDPSCAEDLTQETFYHFFRKLSDYRHMEKSKHYLYTIAGNLCRDYYKKKKESLLGDCPAQVKNRLQYSQTDAIVNKLTVEAALTRLPDELREVIILRYFQDLKLKEISDILQIGLPLVKYRLSQAKLQLEKLLR